MRLGALIIAIGVALFGLSPISHADPSPATANEIVQPAGLPAIGKWMSDSNGEVAHWRGCKFGGQVIDEPVNVILRVHAKDEDSANARLLSAMVSAGFPDRDGHSSGYGAYIANIYFQQFPQQPGHAFSDEPALFSNDHGRLFGPVLWNGAYYYVGAFSREKVNLPGGLIQTSRFHLYESFVRAREKISGALQEKAGASFSGYVPLWNKVENPIQTTGDHDGLAALLDL